MNAMGKVDDEVASIVLQVMAVAHVAVFSSSAVAAVIQRFGCIAGAQSNACRMDACQCTRFKHAPLGDLRESAAVDRFETLA